MAKPDIIGLAATGLIVGGLGYFGYQWYQNVQAASGKALLAAQPPQASLVSRSALKESALPHPDGGLFAQLVPTVLPPPDNAPPSPWDTTPGIGVI